MHIRFGPSGNSPSFYQQGHSRSSEQPAWLRALGLDAYEYSFGRGVRIGEQTAGEIGGNAKAHDIALSVHAPYYINLASEDAQRVESTLGHFIKTARAADWMGAKRIIFHPGAVGKKTRAQAVKLTTSGLKTAVKTLDGLGYGHLTLCPETMGKINQIGDLDETLALCTLDERLIPCLDFGHLYARSLGSFSGRDDFAKALDAVENALGRQRARRLHIHFSRIEFTAGRRKTALELCRRTVRPLLRTACARTNRAQLCAHRHQRK